MLQVLPFAIIASIGVFRMVSGPGWGLLPLLAVGPAVAAAPPDTKKPGHDARTVERILQAPGLAWPVTEGIYPGRGTGPAFRACSKGQVRCVAAGVLLEGLRMP